MAHLEIGFNLVSQGLGNRSTRANRELLIKQQVLDFAKICSESRMSHNRVLLNLCCSLHLQLQTVKQL